MLRLVLLAVSLVALTSANDMNSVCPVGYAVNNGRCEDIDECLNRPCKVNQNCKNIEGSYACSKKELVSDEVYVEKYADIVQFETSTTEDVHSKHGVEYSGAGEHWWSMTTTPLTIHKVNVKVLKLTGAVSLDINIYHGEEKVGKCAPFPIGTEGFVILKCDQVLVDKVELIVTSDGPGELSLKDIKVRGSYTTKHAAVKHYYCPMEFPFPYYHNYYCCVAGYEKNFGPQKDGCDGGVINKDSLCCKGAYRAACKDKSAEGCATPAQQCRKNSCQGANEVCVLAYGKVACECDSGFIEVNGACVAEACDSNPGLCGFKEECVDLSGEFKCLTVCGQGLKRNLAGECEDINECLDDPFICTGDNQVCVNSVGGYSCDCGEGFMAVINQSGYSCITPCGGGYILNKDGECEDVNECMGIPCKGNEDCINNNGGFECKERSNITPLAPAPEPEEPEEGPEDLTVITPPREWVCASSCWSRECDFCSSKTTCGLNYDLDNNSLTIRSRGMTKKTYLKVALYSESDKHLGTLSFNSRGVFLWGCIACRQLKSYPSITSEPQIWVVEKVANSIKISCDGTIIFEQQLSRGCAAFYGVAVSKIGFQSKRTSSVFAEVAVIENMEAQDGFSVDGCRN